MSTYSRPVDREGKPKIKNVNAWELSQLVVKLAEKVADQEHRIKKLESKE